MDDYRSGRWIIVLLKIASWIIGVGNSIADVALIATGTDWHFTLGFIFGGWLAWIFVAAQAALLETNVDIARSTVRAAVALDQIAQTMASANAVITPARLPSNDPSTPTPAGAAAAIGEDAPQQRQCPKCGKTIKAAALKCQYCWAALSA
jgi:hypothetical protein